MEPLSPFATYPISYTPSESPTGPADAVLCRPDPQCSYPDQVTGEIVIRTYAGAERRLQMDCQSNSRIRIIRSIRSHFNAVGGMNGVTLYEYRPNGNLNNRAMEARMAFSLVGPNCQVYYRTTTIWPIIPFSQIQSISVYINWNGRGGPQCVQTTNRP